MSARRRHRRRAIRSDFLATWSPRILSLLRIMAALLLLQYGTAKLFGFPAVPIFAGLPLLSLYGVAGIIEFVGSSFLLVGLFTRAAAFILSGEMAAAYFIGHFPKGFIPLLNGGNEAVLFCFVFLYLAAAGGGAWSLDELRRR
ncbi:DoxX family protein [Bradyrhizobium sp.]|uniref:DoxX family protein n=1 Tax=Bradyrhizobium sp. TaxID=376 RepID=UPI002D4544D5|nr:DoxX family protein [Bradyrhizobium sp.]HZR77038.1 DoxX family protein [Bradyrhizobium sp.]